MKKTLLSTVISALLPLTLTPSITHAEQHTTQLQTVGFQHATQAINELVIIDAGVENKAPFYRQKQSGIHIVELDADKDGQQQLAQILHNYHNLSALHIISHATDGEVQLGNASVDKNNLSPTTLVALNEALQEGGDILFYGCDLAATEKGHDFLEQIKSNTHADVVASSDKTGNETYGADWELEVKKGDIEAQVLADARALYDFHEVLNTLPTAQEFTKRAEIGQPMVITTADIGFEDTDASDALDHIKVSSTYTKADATVWIDSNNNNQIDGAETKLSDEDQVSAADIAADKLKYIQWAGSPKQKDLQYHVHDGKAYSENSYRGVFITESPDFGHAAFFEQPHQSSGDVGIAISPDGKHTYLINTTYDVIQTIVRDTHTGRTDKKTDKIQVANIQDLRPGRTDHSGNTIPTEPRVLDAPISVIVSADGKNVYVGTRSHIVAFTRDLETGKLSYLGSIHEFAAADGNSAAKTSARFEYFEIAANGKYIFATHGDFRTRITRNTETGALSDAKWYPLTAQQDSSLFSTTSPNDQFHYILDYDNQTISVFTLDTATGNLSSTASQVIESDTFSTQDVTLQSPRTIKISPDGKYAYVLDVDRDHIFIFAINETTGQLTPATIPFATTPPIHKNRDGLQRMEFSQDGSRLYVVSDADADSDSYQATDTLTAYARDTETGALVRLKSWEEGRPDRYHQTPPIDQTSLVVVAPDDLIYTMGGNSSGIGIFEMQGRLLHVTAEDGDYREGGTVTITIEYSRIVNVTGTPQLNLSNGGIATYVSGSGSKVLTFEYVVPSTYQPVNGLEYSSLDALDLNGGSIQDIHGIDISPKLPELGSDHSLAGSTQNNILVNDKPTISLPMPPGGAAFRVAESDKGVFTQELTSEWLNYQDANGDELKSLQIAFEMAQGTVSFIFGDGREVVSDGSVLEIGKDEFEAGITIKLEVHPETPVGQEGAAFVVYVVRVFDGVSFSDYAQEVLVSVPPAPLKADVAFAIDDTSMVSLPATLQQNTYVFGEVKPTYEVTRVPTHGNMILTTPPADENSQPQESILAVGDTFTDLTHVSYRPDANDSSEAYSFAYTVQYSESHVSAEQVVSFYRPQPQEGLAQSFVNTEVSNPSSMVVSSDGEWLYALSYDDSTLSTFKRDPITGELTLLETLVDEETDSFGNELVNYPIYEGYNLVISPDNQTVYVSSYYQISVFQKDAATGKLRYVQTFGYYQDDSDPDVLYESDYYDYGQLQISQDGRFLYTGIYSSAGIIQFSRDPDTGLLSSPVVIEAENDYNFTIRLSPDDRYLYAMDFDEGYIYIYQRDEQTGVLTKAHVIEDIDAMSAPWDMLITQDGTKAYVSDVTNESILIFDRNIEDGTLAFYKSVELAGQDIDYDHYTAERMFFNDDESIIYLATDDDDYNRVLSFKRNLETGNLRLLMPLEDEGTDAYGNSLEHMEGAISLVPTVLGEGNDTFYVSGHEGITLFDTQPRIINITSDKEDGVYGAGEEITITVQFNRAVVVEGTPQLSLNSGAVVDYSSGSGTDTLTFNYTVGATDSATDFNYEAVDALSLNGGSIQDIKGLAALIELPPTDHAKSLGENKALVINALPQAKNSSVTLEEDGSKTITLDASDAETANLTYTLKTQPSNGTLGAISNGEVTYTPNANWHGSDSFSYSVTDEQGAESGTATVSITVNSVNDEPVISSTAITDTVQYANYSYTFAASDVDTDNTLAITSTATLPSWLTLTDNGDGTATLVGTPDQAAVGTHNISLQVSDGEANIAQNFTINVANINDAPVIGSTAPTHVEQDKAYSYTLTVSDLDNDSLTLSIEDKPDWLTFDAATGILSGTPTQNEVGDHAIKLRVSDGIETIEQNYTLNVIDINDAPEITSTAIENVNEDEAYQYIINTNDIDPDASLTITAEGLPEWLTLTDQGNGSATLSGTPTQDDVAETEVTIQVSDGELSDTQIFTLVVKAVNDSPEFATDTQRFDIAENGETAIATIAATDVDNETLSYSLSGDDASIFAIDEASGALSFKAVPDFDAPTDANADNTYHVTVKAEDADGASAEQAITVNVTDVALAVGQTNIVLTIPTSTTKDSVIGDLGLAGDALQSLQITQNSSDVITVSQQGAISVAVDNLTAGTHTLMVEVSDGTTPITVSIAVHILGAIEETTQDQDANNDGINDHLAASFGKEDTDKDGIPDALERLISDDLSLVNASSDADQDGMPDVAEIMVGRDPKVDDQVAVGAPSITVTQTALSLASTGVQSSYTQNTLGVSVSDASLTAVAYFKTDSCKESLPYNYKTVCKAVPETGFTSGQHDIWWVAEDSTGNWVVAEQSLTILPAIAFASDLILAGQAGTGTLTTQLSLNGSVATAQDFTVPFVVSGTAQAGNDYTLSATEFTFKAGELDSQPITITMGNNPTSGNELILTLNESATVIASTEGNIDKNTQFVVLGEKPSQTITVAKDTSYAPILSSLTGMQAQGTDNEVRGLFFEKSNGAITLSFSSYDPDGGAYSYDWSKSDADIVANLSATTVQKPELNTVALESKSYRIEVRVTDSTTNQPAATLSAVLSLFDGMVLTDKDSDGDGTPDSEEGLKDSDGDGVMDYLDAFDGMANNLPTDSLASQNYLVTVDTGLRVKLGETAQFASTGDAQVDLDDLKQFGNKGQVADNVDKVTTEELAAVFDYEVENLSVPADLKQGGLTANIVLPLSQPLTSTSDFLKYNATDGWTKFIIDDNNKLAWAGWKEGVEGQCPLSHSDAYSSDVSLKTGKHCLRVTLQDGGENDADGAINGRIVDPLAIAKQAKDLDETLTIKTSSGGGSTSWWVLLLLALGAMSRKLVKRQN